MAELRRHSTIFGVVGALCLSVYLTARFVPEVADTYALSSLGKFVVFGTLPISILLTTIAAIKGSRWWLVVVAAGVIALGELYLRFGMPIQ
jgi:hypothetical protein